jgi:hypothetical protein
LVLSKTKNKQSKQNIMKTLIFSLLVLAMTASFAQQQVIWKGGTPGHETSWNEPRNWSTYQVPDEFSHVVIMPLHTGHHAQPVIDQEVEVASIQVHTGAKLTIKIGGEILVDGESSNPHELGLFGGVVILENKKPTLLTPTETVDSSFLIAKE